MSTPLNEEAPDSAVSADQKITVYETSARDYPQHGSVSIRLNHSERQSTTIQIAKSTAESLHDQLNAMLAVPADTVNSVTGEQVNFAGWTCDGIHEPGDYSTCNECREACDDLANFYNQMMRNPRPGKRWTGDTVNSAVEAFINQRPEYITALKNTRGTDDQTDYHRWQGGAEARRQLAETLGWTVPHNPGETTRPEARDA